MLENSKCLDLPEFIKFCKVFAVPLSSKKCLAVFKQVLEPVRDEGRSKSLPGKSATLDFIGFKTALN